MSSVKIMEYIPKNDLLQQKEDSLMGIRKIYDLHKPGRLEEAVDILEEWVKKQAHFLKTEFTREYYERTLISSKGSVEKAKKTIDRLCTMKTLMPKFFTKTNAKLELTEITKIAWLLPLPKMTQDYHRVLLMKINSKDFEPHNYMEYYQYSIILTEYIKRHDYANGFLVVYDFRTVNMMDLVTKMNVVELQQFMTVLVEGYGARLRGLYMISESKTIELLIRTIKQFLSKKINSRVQVIPTFKDLDSLVPRDVMPEDYGGTERSSEVLIGQWVDALSTDDHVEYMKMMNKAGTNESLRQSANFNEDYMGMPGSFRALTVD